MATNKEQIQNCKTTQELAQWIAVFMQSGKLNPNVDYESAITWVKIIRWLEEEVDG